MDGIQRTLTGGACNTHIPTLANQSNFITEKTSLPIVKVLYGPLIHEAQSAKVLIGPLICEPKPLDDDWSRVNLETHVKTLAQKMDNHEISINTFEDEFNNLKDIINDTESSLNEEIEKLKKFHEKPICPVNDQRFRILLDVCYYFENTLKNFGDALLNCKDKSGKLYEPTDITTFNEIQREAESIFGTVSILTGFTKIDNNGNLKHSSNGLQLYDSKTCEKLGSSCVINQGMSESVIVFYSSSNSWSDVTPAYNSQSICVIT